MHRTTFGTPINGTRVIDRETLARVAPSVFATSPYHAMSDRYKFLPTIEVIDALADVGFLPVLAAQSRTRIPGKADFTRHMVRMRHRDNLDTARVVGSEVAEIVMTNSHDGSSAIVVDAGVFRLACLNGMVVKSRDDGGFKLRHSGRDDWYEQVIDATFTIVDTAQRGVETMREWSQIALSPPEQVALAGAALQIREVPNATPTDILRVRRSNDAGSDLNTVFNRIQENVVRGGIRTTNTETGRSRRTREVSSIGENLKINRALWTLGEEMARIKGL